MISREDAETVLRLWAALVLVGDPDACPSCGAELSEMESKRGVVCCARCGGFIVDCYSVEFDLPHSTDDTIGGES